MTIVTPQRLIYYLNAQTMFDETAQNFDSATATAVEDGNTSAIQHGGLVPCHQTRIGTVLSFNEVMGSR